MRSGNWKFVPVLKQELRMRLFTVGFICAPLLLMPALVQAQDWQVQVGAQSKDMGRQVIAFLPNEVWIHAGDSVAFTVASDEPHTVTFLTLARCGRLFRLAVQAQAQRRTQALKIIRPA